MGLGDPLAAVPGTAAAVGVVLVDGAGLGGGAVLVAAGCELLPHPATSTTAVTATAARGPSGAPLDPAVVTEVFTKAVQKVTAHH